MGTTEDSPGECCCVLCAPHEKVPTEHECVNPFVAPTLLLASHPWLLVRLLVPVWFQKLAGPGVVFPWSLLVAPLSIVRVLPPQLSGVVVDQLPSQSRESFPH